MYKHLGDNYHDYEYIDSFYDGEIVIREFYDNNDNYITHFFGSYIDGYFYEMLPIVDSECYPSWTPGYYDDNGNPIYYLYDGYMNDDSGEFIILSEKEFIPGVTFENNNDSELEFYNALTNSLIDISNDFMEFIPNTLNVAIPISGIIILSILTIKFFKKVK